MRIQIKVKRPAFSTIFKICAVSLFAYVLAIFCLGGIAALGGKLHVDERLGAVDLLVGIVLGPTLIPIGFGFMMALPAVALWALYSRFRKSVIVLHIDNLSDIETVEEPNQSPQRNAGVGPANSGEASSSHRALSSEKTARPQSPRG